MNKPYIYVVMVDCGDMGERELTITAWIRLDVLSSNQPCHIVTITMATLKFSRGAEVCVLPDILNCPVLRNKYENEIYSDWRKAQDADYERDAI